MRYRPGERLRCCNPDCRLEVIVLGIGAGKEPEALLICHCGSPMKKSYQKPVANKIKLDRGIAAKH
jgi:hypothetical protein